MFFLYMAAAPVPMEMNLFKMLCTSPSALPAILVCTLRLRRKGRLRFRVFGFAGGRGKSPPHLPVADEEGRRDTFNAQVQGLATKVVNVVPFAPQLESIKG